MTMYELIFDFRIGEAVVSRHSYGPFQVTGRAEKPVYVRRKKRKTSEHSGSPTLQRTTITSVRPVIHVADPHPLAKVEASFVDDPVVRAMDRCEDIIDRLMPSDQEVFITRLCEKYGFYVQSRRSEQKYQMYPRARMGTFEAGVGGGSLGAGGLSSLGKGTSASQFAPSLPITPVSVVEQGTYDDMARRSSTSFANSFQRTTSAFSHVGGGGGGMGAAIDVREPSDGYFDTRSASHDRYPSASSDRLPSGPFDRFPSRTMPFSTQDYEYVRMFATPRYGSGYVPSGSSTQPDRTPSYVDQRAPVPAFRSSSGGNPPSM
eukprot:TRINITY_DN1679_c0_g1_i2.p1 TRINITY_DN1679_c0_g1~~TRINITY_DN1679_c0_g1_i2.p1  ORF type:complete len:318 (+),score=52.19 TRINITY_DN1679_c0_g1_i2:890-1843(+)